MGLLLTSKLYTCGDGVRMQPQTQKVRKSLGVCISNSWHGIMVLVAVDHILSIKSFNLPSSKAIEKHFQGFG